MQNWENLSVSVLGNEFRALENEFLVLGEMSFGLGEMSFGLSEMSFGHFGLNEFPAKRTKKSLFIVWAE